MSKRGVIHMVLAVLLMAYIAVAMYFTSKMEAADRYKGVDITIDNTVKGFVQAADIDHELGLLSERITLLPHDSVNTRQIEEIIRAMDNIETANCAVLANNRLSIDVVPLVPIARVFDLNGYSYYINQAGKQMKASARFRIDVPIVTGRFNSRIKPTDVFPVLDYLKHNPDMGAMVSQLRVARNGDIYLVPMVTGHVVNLGDTTDLANKFQRIGIFYREVMPVKGWEYYDTLSVKWRGQVVAHKHKAVKHNEFEILDEDTDIADLSTMSVE